LPALAASGLDLRAGYIEELLSLLAKKSPAVTVLFTSTVVLGQLIRTEIVHQDISVLCSQALCLACPPQEISCATAVFGDHLSSLLQFILYFYFYFYFWDAQ
jgi:hypothetical protein